MMNVSDAMRTCVRALQLAGVCLVCTVYGLADATLMDAIVCCSNLPMPVRHWQP